jgi:menaquinone-dependent protoporphyrinogen IX oxidase
VSTSTKNGRENMRIFVGYASGYGSTRSYAEVIGDELGKAGHETVVLPAKSSRDIEAYDFVVIGGSIRAGKWLASARKLARRVVKHEKGHAVFFCCLSARTEEGRKTVLGDYLERVREKVPGLAPLEVGAFPGMANYEQYRFPVRGIMTGIARREGVDFSVNQDYRDLEAAREWARVLIDRLR